MTTRVGIAGCGFIGTVHSLALKWLVDEGEVDAAVTATFDPDHARAEEMASHHEGARAVASPGELLAAVDALWVCTPTAAHLALVEAAATAGVAVYCEKPLGRDLAEAEAVAAALARTRHQVGLVLRHAPVWNTLKAEIDSGRHGPVMAVVFRDDQYFPNQGIYRSAWRADVAQAGGGTLVEHSVHDLDLVRWLLGDPDEVAATTRSFAGHEGVEDLAVVHLSYGGGPEVTLTSVWHQVLSRPSTRRVEVFCEQALLWLDDDHVGPLHVETSQGHHTEPSPLLDPLAMYAVPDREFLAGGAWPGAAEALAAHRLVAAAYRSAAAGGSRRPFGA